jgi:hypothetical protein
MNKQYRVIFLGTIHDGLDIEHVKLQAAKRLHATQDQLNRIFLGRRVILKQHLSAEQGWAYVRVLEQIGMLVELESMPAEAPAAAPQTPVKPPIQPQTAVSPISAKTQPSAPTEVAPPASAKESDLSQFERTHINLARAEALLNGYISTEAIPAQNITHTPPAIAQAPAPKDSAEPLDKVQRELAALEAYLGAHELPPTAAPPPTPPTSHTNVSTIPLAARQSLSTSPLSAPIPQQSLTNKQVPLIFSTIIECAHCGTSHVIEGQVMVSIQPQRLHSKAG